MSGAGLRNLLRRWNVPEDQWDDLFDTVARVAAREFADDDLFNAALRIAHDAEAERDRALDGLRRMTESWASERRALDELTELRNRIERACSKAEALTQDVMGVRSKHWRGPDYADGLDNGIETTTSLVRDALREPS